MQLTRLTTAVLFISVLASSRAAQAQVAPSRESRPEPALVRALAGCYALHLGVWSSAPTLGPDRPTELVRLDTLPGPSGAPRGTFVAKRLAPPDTILVGMGPAGRRLRAQWRVIPPDSVEIMPWLSSFEAEIFYGHTVGGELRGMVRRTSDAIPVDSIGHILWDAYPSAPATVRRVPCPPE